MKIKNLAPVLGAGVLLVAGLVGVTVPAQGATAPGNVAAVNDVAGRPNSLPPLNVKGHQPPAVQKAKAKAPRDLKLASGCSSPCYSYAGARFTTTNTNVVGAVDNMLV